MIGRLAIVIAGLLIFAVLLVVSRNLKRQRIITETPSYKCAEAIGDGACPWHTTVAKYPAIKSRDFEPRGM